jgi:hypothetical protein
MGATVISVPARYTVSRAHVAGWWQVTDERGFVAYRPPRRRNSKPRRAFTNDHQTALDWARTLNQRAAAEDDTSSAPTTPPPARKKRGRSFRSSGPASIS